VETRECRLILLLKRPRKQKARKFTEKAEPIPKWDEANGFALLL
jgi:hypothetical protein